MRAAIWILALAGFLCQSEASRACAADIPLQNSGVEVFQYSVRQDGETAWSRTFELGPGQTRTLPATRPVVISYWTDKPRFMTLQPGQAYRIQDVCRGELQPVTMTLGPSSSAEPSAATPPKTDAVPVAKPGARSGPATAPSAVPAAAASPAVRVVRVRALADATYRRVVDDWSQRIRTVVMAASEYFEANFQIRFQLVAIQPWEYRGVARHPESRLKALLAIEPEDADLLLAFIGFGEFYTAGETTYITGLLGMGMPLGQHVMVSGDDHFHINRDKVVLMHELAHVFGAFHVDNRRSLMYPIHSGVPTEILAEGKFELEPPLREVILAARNLDFRRGVDSLDPQVRQRIQTLTRQYRLPRESRAPSPVGMARVVRELRDNAQGRLGRPAESAADNSPASPNQDETLRPGENVRVIAEETALRAGELTLASLPFGEVLEVEDQQDGWVRVIASERGVRGWIPLKSLADRENAGQIQVGQSLVTATELELTVADRVVATLPAGITAVIKDVAQDRVEILAGKQEVARYAGGKLVFEPLVQGWVLRQHVARSETADLTE